MSDDNSLGKQISKTYFVSLVKEQANTKAEISELAGDLGERLKKAQDGSNLHLKAFRTICQMNRMEEQKRNAFRDCLMLYLDFADEELWGGKHVGDLDKMARAAAAADEEEERAEPGDAAEEEISVDEQMAENGRLASGIKELPADAPDGKPKRGRPRKGSLAILPPDPLTALKERGRLDFEGGKPGMIPDDLSGKAVDSQAYLEGWSAASKAAADRQDGIDPDAEFDDATSTKPSRRQNERRETLPGADAPGSYTITH